MNYDVWNPHVGEFVVTEPADLPPTFPGDLYPHPDYGAVVVVRLWQPNPYQREVTFRPATIEEMRDHGY